MEEVTLETTFLIFISYRRDDAESDARRLYDYLVRRFGEEVAFFYRDIIPGEVRPDLHMEAVMRTSEKCDLLLPVIGPHWLTVTDEEGQRRLDNPNDLVRLGIEAALGGRGHIIPILLHGAHMPSADDLPESLEGLVDLYRAEAVQFEVRIPPQFDSSTVVGTVIVSLDSIPIGHVKFTLGVEGAHPSESEPVGDQAKRFSPAFVSYASADRPKVIPRVQMLKSVGIESFQDILDLDPGERWEATLYRKIDECDLFLLFWSSEAKRSEWVRREVAYAMARKARDEFAPPEVRPVIIEGPPLVPPWEELADLHFNDRLLYLQQA